MKEKMEEGKEEMERRKRIKIVTCDFVTYLMVRDVSPIVVLLPTS